MMCIEPMGTAQIKRVTRRDRPLGGYKIPYIDALGRDTGFFRIRLLGESSSEPSAASAFGVTDNGTRDDMRYFQPARTAPRLYLPPSPNIDWEDVQESTDIELVITEGEKKAYTLSKVKRTAVGIGGVWSFGDRKRGYALLPDLLAFRLAGRSVLIIFDSDVTVNEQVRAARNTFSRALSAEGAFVRVLTLPPGISGERRGVDDLLVSDGVETLDKLIYENATAPDAADKLEVLNQRFAVIENVGRIVRLDRLEVGEVVLYSQQDFRLITANQLYTPPPKLSADGIPKPQAPRSVGPAWLDWPGRRDHVALTYDPGAPRVTKNRELNLWSKAKLEPTRPKRATSLKPWIRLRDYVFQDDPDLIPWFEQWCAYPLQHPGTKLYTAVLVHGVYQGTGKSLLGITIGKLYGQNFGIVERDALYAQFNEWSLYKQFVLADEVFGSDKRADADLLKSIITRDRISVNLKNVRQFTMPDRINYFLTSNHPDALYLEESDRRFAVARIDHAPLADSFYAEYDAWMNSTGPSELLWYLTQRIDVSKFNPKAPAPRSESKKVLISVGASEVDVFARSLRDAPDHILRRADDRLDGDWWTARDLAAICFQGEPVRGQAISLGRALLRAGIKRIELPNYGLPALYLVRPRNGKWERAVPSEVMAHYYQTRRPRERPMLTVVEGGSTAPMLKRKRKF